MMTVTAVCVPSAPTAPTATQARAVLSIAGHALVLLDAGIRTSAAILTAAMLQRTTIQSKVKSFSNGRLELSVVSL